MQLRGSSRGGMKPIYLPIVVFVMFGGLEIWLKCRSVFFCQDVRLRLAPLRGILPGALDLRTSQMHWKWMSFRMSLQLRASACPFS